MAYYVDLQLNTMHTSQNAFQYNISNIFDIVLLSNKNISPQHIPFATPHHTNKLMLPFRRLSNVTQHEQIADAFSEIQLFAICVFVSMEGCTEIIVDCVIYSLISKISSHLSSRNMRTTLPLKVVDVKTYLKVGKISNNS